MILLKILFAHCLGDYFLQTDYLALNKSKNNYILFIHAVLYTFGVYLVFASEINIFWYLIILLSHIPIDYIKARGVTPTILGDKNALILDQVIHYITLLLALMF